MVSEMFDQAQGLEPGDETLRELAAQIEKELSLHLEIEERLFYDELRRRAEDSEELVDMFAAFTEHKAAKSLIQMLQSGRKADEQFKAELQVLGESVKHHVEEEESKVFEIARKVMDQEELDERGEAWEKAKQRAMSRRPAGRKSSTRKSTSAKKSASAKKSTAKRKKTARTRR